MIDENIHKELRNRFNPDGSDLRKMQLRMLEMLKYIDAICTKNGIKYWLSSGTCLGAVRHGGFIPWDDDVDIEMERKDYKKLIKILRNEPGDYVLQDYKSDPEYILSFAKLRDSNSFVKENNDSDKFIKYSGIYIDIFPINKSASRILFLSCSVLWRNTIARTKNISNKKLRRALHLGFNMLLRNFVFPLVNLIQFPFYTDTYRHSLGSFFPFKRDGKDFETTVRIPFEGIMLPVPENYDSYLRGIYGEYSNLPDIDKITPHLVEVRFFNKEPQQRND